ncbi:MULTISPECIES: LptM family lipoprotein [unclassified Campylobacter]|uniref:LptM family lipoprotein n=1 Tax=unclassified Campylobacter TaxID=2593542 RepID=UPI0022E9C1F5|nr:MULTISPECIES: hypothetical protein [unclassified Campylobacter]MDA3054776.1 hypothetical protein [Campylobacter sp. VBCF_07 NA4]MDA3061191.1 hypothetical protein [Campylobacter sp. VBCF_02 NA5]MDA3070725.1 hypothetical protein [Campylobacter sp. VBCF_08 NA3]WBR54230.1 hypothetical protein PF027_07930 [Campylobacter sp. VBCF_01 NA2]
MKNLFSFMLASALCAVLAGCGGDDSQSSANAGGETEKPAQEVAQKPIERSVEKPKDPALEKAEKEVEAMSLKDFVVLFENDGCFKVDTNQTAKLACEGKFEPYAKELYSSQSSLKNGADNVLYLYYELDFINDYFKKNKKLGSVSDMLASKSNISDINKNIWRRAGVIFINGYGKYLIIRDSDIDVENSTITLSEMDQDIYDKVDKISKDLGDTYFITSDHYFSNFHNKKLAREAELKDIYRELAYEKGELKGAVFEIKDGKYVVKFPLADAMKANIKKARQILKKL